MSSVWLMLGTFPSMLPAQQVDGSQVPTGTIARNGRGRSLHVLLAWKIFYFPMQPSLAAVARSEGKVLSSLSAPWAVRS